MADRRRRISFGSQRAGSLRIAEGGICAGRRRRICCGSQKADQLRIVECGPAADRICCGTQKTDLMRIAEGGSQKADQLRIAECGLAVGRRRRISCGSHCGSQKADLFGIAENGPVADRRSQASYGSQKAGQLRIAEGGSAAILTGVYGYAERQLASHMRFQNRTRDMNETVNLIARNAHTKNQVI